MKSKSFFRKFYKDNKFIAITGTLAVLYCLLCTVFKSNSFINIFDWMRPAGELLYNVAISVIAAVIFFIVQVYLVNKKRDDILKKYSRKYVREGVIKECDLLKTRLECVKNEEHEESEVNEAIASNCDKIRSYIQICINNYVYVLPENVIDKMNGILFDDFFYLVEIRAKGYLKNKKMISIVNDKELYNNFLNLVNRIKDEMKTE